MREDALYPPVKAFLEAQGYGVKPVIVELKTGFSLPLVFQEWPGRASPTMSISRFRRFPSARPGGRTRWRSAAGSDSGC